MLEPAGDGSAVWFDPSAYPAVIAGVATAYDTFSGMPVADPASSGAQPVPPEFGAIGADWQAFDRAWSAESTTALHALEKYAQLLPVIAAGLHNTDGAGGQQVPPSAPPPTTVDPKSDAVQPHSATMGHHYAVG